MTISLSDLKSKRAAITQGEWRQGELDRGSAFDTDGHGVLMCKRDIDAAGIVATHNAADCLIAVCEAAIALVGPAKPSDALLPEFNALLAALAKVAP